MTVAVDIEMGYEFTVRAPYKEVFDLLANVPRSVSHFPKVERLVDLGRGIYRWEMEEVGTAHFNIQTIYASKYVSDRKKGLITWTPVKGEGNARVGGSWTVAEARKGTQLQLRIQGSVDLPVPALMKTVVATVVSSEFELLVEKYIDNLCKALGGEV